MGSILHERVDFRPKFMPKTITDFLNELSTICNVSEKSSKLNDYIKSLEDEMRKIDAFKRELPLCMLLLKDAILYLNDESVQCTTANVEPVLEEFIPLKKNDCNEEMNEVDKKEDCRDKKNWMSSVQLWNSDDHSAISSEHNSKVETKKVVEEVDRSAGENPFQTCKGREEGKTFIPFKGYPTFLSTVVARREGKKDLSASALSLLTPGIKNSKEESGSSHSKPSCSRLGSFPISKVQSNLRTGPQQPQHQQTNRKQRRCWSPELHRRFVNSLQQLGGSQAATPKQIRELMQVDGLTNDEVKSHLQKYRLHSRRHPNATPATLTNQSAVVMGGLWTPRDQYVESSKQSNSQSGSPEGPLQLAGNTGGTTITGDYSMEDDDEDEDEDEKSESYSWRSHIHKPRKDDV